MTTRNRLYLNLAQAAAAPYLRVSRFAHGFANGKLTRDPIFEYVLTEGLLTDADKILDLGCGQGVLAALVWSCQQAQADGKWPPQWASPPRAQKVIGIELMPRDVERGRQALGETVELANFVLGDISQTPFPAVDAVVIFDVLHYLPFDAQLTVLNNVKTALNGQGTLLLRIGDADAGLGFQISQWTDRIVTWCRGHRMPPTFCRTLAQWETQLQELGFRTTTNPMSDGTLFSNVLITAQIGGEALRDA